MGKFPVNTRNNIPRKVTQGTLYVNLQPYPEFSLALFEDNREGDEGGDFDSSSPVGDWLPPPAAPMRAEDLIVNDAFAAVPPVA